MPVDIYKWRSWFISVDNLHEYTTLFWKSIFFESLFWHLFSVQLEEAYWQAFRCKLGELGNAVEIHDCPNKEGFILGQNVRSFIVFHFYEELPILFVCFFFLCCGGSKSPWTSLDSQELYVFMCYFVYIGPTVLQ